MAKFVMRHFLPDLQKLLHTSLGAESNSKYKACLDATSYFDVGEDILYFLGITPRVFMSFVVSRQPCQPCRHCC